MSYDSGWNVIHLNYCDLKEITFNQRSIVARSTRQEHLHPYWRGVTWSDWILSFVTFWYKSVTAVDPEDSCRRQDWGALPQEGHIETYPKIASDKMFWTLPNSLLTTFQWCLATFVVTVFEWWKSTRKDLSLNPSYCCHSIWWFPQCGVWTEWYSWFNILYRGTVLKRVDIFTRTISRDLVEYIQWLTHHLDSSEIRLLQHYFVSFASTDSLSEKVFFPSK